VRVSALLEVDRSRHAIYFLKFYMVNIINMLIISGYRRSGYNNISTVNIYTMQYIIHTFIKIENAFYDRSSKIK